MQLQQPVVFHYILMLQMNCFVSFSCLQLFMETKNEAPHNKTWKRFPALHRGSRLMSVLRAALDYPHNSLLPSHHLPQHSYAALKLKPQLCELCPASSPWEGLCKLLFYSLTICKNCFVLYHLLLMYYYLRSHEYCVDSL